LLFLFAFSEVLKVTWSTVPGGRISLEIVIALGACTSRVDVVVTLYFAVRVFAYWLLALFVCALSALDDLVVWACTACTVVQKLLSGLASISLTSLSILLLGVFSACYTCTILLLQYLIVIADILDAALLIISICEFSYIFISRACCFATCGSKPFSTSCASILSCCTFTIRFSGQLWACIKALTSQSLLFASSTGYVMAFVVLS